METNDKDEEYSPDDRSVSISISLDGSDEENCNTSENHFKEYDIECKPFYDDIDIDEKKDKNEDNGADEEQQEDQEENKEDSDEETKNWKRKRFEEREGEIDINHGVWRRFKILLEEENKVEDLMGGIWNWNKKFYETKEEENAPISEEWGRWRRKKTEELNEGQNDRNGTKSKCRKKKVEETEGGEWFVDMTRRKQGRGNLDNFDVNGHWKETKNVELNDEDEIKWDKFNGKKYDNWDLCRSERIFRDKQYRNNWKKKRIEEIESEKNSGDSKIDWKRSVISTDEDKTSDDLEGKTKTWKITETITKEDFWQPEYDGGELKKHRSSKSEETNFNERENFGSWRRWKIMSAHDMEERRVWKLK